MKTVRQKIEDGDYNTKIPYPSSPAMPAVLRKSARDLTDEEIKTLSEVKRDHEKSIEAVKKLRRDHQEDENRLMNQFREDLALENGVHGNPKEPLLWEKAWSYGHSSGLEEVLSYHDDLCELIK